MAIKYYVPMTAQSPPTWFQKYKMRPQTQDDMYIYTLAGSWIWGHEVPLAKIKMECRWWPEKPLILVRSETYYVAMLSLSCGAHLVESYCKESNIQIQHTNKLAEISFFIIFDQNLVKCMMSSLG